MGRGRFFPCPFHGTKETTRTHAPALRAAADGVGALCALRGSRRRIRKFARRDFFFSSPRAGGDSSRPPSSHKKRSLRSSKREPFCSPRSLGAATLRPALSSVFSESITRTWNFVVVRAVFRLAASSKKIDDAALRSSGVRVSNPVRPAANTSGDTTFFVPPVLL